MTKTAEDQDLHALETGSSRRIGRVAWRRSAEDRDCGAAAFAMVMSHYGCELTTEEARDIVKTDRSGTSMRWICEGARSLGFSARGARATFDGLAQVSLPAICHYDDGEGHYVVVTHWSPRGVRVLDPFLGPQRISRAAFEADFSGFVVDLRPTDRSVARPPTFRARTELAPFFRKDGLALCLASLLGASVILLGLVLARFVGEALDTALNGESVAIGALVAKLGAAAGVAFAAQLIRMRLVVRAGERLELVLGKRFVNRIQHAPVRNFEERCPVAFGGRLAESQIIRDGCVEAGTWVASSLVVVATAIVVVFQLDFVLGLALMLAAPVLLALTQAAVGSGAQAEFGASRTAFRLLTRLVDGFTEFHTIKMFNAQPGEMKELRSRIGDAAEANTKVFYARQLPAVVSQLFTVAVQIGLLAVMTQLISKGAISAGETLTAFAAIGIALGATQGIPSSVQRISAGLITLDRWQEIMYMPLEANVDLVDHELPPQLDAPATGSGQIAAVESTDVDYGPPGRNILNGLNLEITHGERIAIVGATGAGKTTIARMLAMFDPITSGTLRLFGHSISDLRPETVRSLVTVVFQDTRLLQRSLRDNLMLGLEETAVDESDLTHALALCGLDDVMGMQRLGLDTHAARAGRNFSSGQGQRFALARAMLRRPAILVLDEATANVDSANEAEVLERVFNERDGLTTIVMAHRFATLKFVDRVIVMRDGKIVEQGSVDQLTAVRGEFHRLFSAQMSSAATSVRDA